MSTRPGSGTKIPGNGHAHHPDGTDAEHQAILKRIRVEARRLGFQSTLWDQAADLLVYGGSMFVAIKIIVNDQTSHNFVNVKKCLNAGLTHVAIVSPHLKQLADLAIIAQARLDEEMAANVDFYTPGDFIGGLRKLAAETPDRHTRSRPFSTGLWGRRPPPARNSTTPELSGVRLKALPKSSAKQHSLSVAKD